MKLCSSGKCIKNIENAQQWWWYIGMWVLDFGATQTNYEWQLSSNYQNCKCTFLWHSNLISMKLSYRYMKEGHQKVHGNVCHEKVMHEFPISLHQNKFTF